jgi:hypothetical protein
MKSEKVAKVMAETMNATLKKVDEGDQAGEPCRV